MTTGFKAVFNHAAMGTAPAAVATVKQTDSPDLHHVFNGVEQATGGNPVTLPEPTAELVAPETARRVSNLHEVLGMPRIPRRKHG